jgi:hypothetical protein
MGSRWCKHLPPVPGSTPADTSGPEASGQAARMVLGCRSDVDPPYGPARTGRHGGGHRRWRLHAHTLPQRPDLRIRRRTQPDQPSANRTNYGNDLNTHKLGLRIRRLGVRIPSGAQDHMAPDLRICGSGADPFPSLVDGLVLLRCSPVREGPGPAQSGEQPACPYRSRSCGIRLATARAETQVSGPQTV